MDGSDWVMLVSLVLILSGLSLIILGSNSHQDACPTFNISNTLYNGCESGCLMTYGQTQGVTNATQSYQESQCRLICKAYNPKRVE